VLRYVDRNALRANLVKRAEQWRWVESVAAATGGRISASAASGVARAGAG